MKVLVTGGAGFIGSHICDKLIELNYQVVCVDNLSNGSVHNINHLKSNANFKFYELDINEFEIFTKSYNFNKLAKITKEYLLNH